MHTPDICPIDPHKNNFLQLENCSRSSPFQFLKKRGWGKNDIRCILHYKEMLSKTHKNENNAYLSYKSSNYLCQRNFLIYNSKY